MENILNMGCSLKAIEYLINIQLEENLLANSIYIRSAYDFFNETEYKKEVSSLLRGNNNDNDFLLNTLKSHYELCKSIITSWYGFLLAISDEVIQKTLIRNTDSYNIYCSLVQPSIADGLRATNC